ncbi:hypothetical protein HAX54_031941 [Datura stramonium]|uniref:Uncharacterized protein n=1 Tax=Datura stramonium TaxID=4076 RepID=A0ABS8SCA1_DATST|nr:hypothetical protein [Datura stramonium]
MAKNIILICLIFIVLFGLAVEAIPLQDFCVADTTSDVMQNGQTCKNPILVNVNDFYYSGSKYTSQQGSSDAVLGDTARCISKYRGLILLAFQCLRLTMYLVQLTLHTFTSVLPNACSLEGSLHDSFTFKWALEVKTQSPSFVDSPRIQISGEAGRGELIQENIVIFWKNGLRKNTISQKSLFSKVQSWQWLA